MMMNETIFRSLKKFYSLFPWEDDSQIVRLSETVGYNWLCIPLHGLALEYMALKLRLDPGVRMIGLDGDDF